MEPITLGFAVFGIIAPVGVWAVRTEGRINTLKEIVDERDKKLDDRLERIENKMDVYFLSKGKQS
jgi:hypothetical protein